MTDIHALAGAYVLHALDDVERAAFRRHLADCGTCATEVAELREAAARLADPTWSVPPPRLRDEVLAAVRRTPQERPGRAARPGRAGGAGRWRRRVALAVAAGALVAGGGAVTWTVQEQRVRHERATVTALTAERDRIRAVLTAPDAVVRTRVLPGGGRVSVVISSTLDRGVVTLGGLPRPAGDRTYQLWLFTGTTPGSAGVLPAGADAGTVLVAGVRDRTLFGVTEEPAGGSARPTTPPLTVMSLT
ncbi:anti-sigma factor [Micromonospora sp. WMMD882]|uniref:anti-sigma factor n=1 Tax=Micromonospora sp. WMMD882 TaxID=3015151 RepID=UPI00248B3FA4|nr:anti-sigma factor [Micromonospora sp. WMMD882]WBB79441.1 anti-sigma factor [Micromonospora sp. WMMD882]